MLLDARTLALAPRAPELLALLDGDWRFKLELPAAQIELLTPPGATAGEGDMHRLVARHDLAAAARRWAARRGRRGAPVLGPARGTQQRRALRRDARRVRGRRRAAARLRAARPCRRRGRGGDDRRPRRAAHTAARARSARRRGALFRRPRQRPRLGATAARRAVAAPGRAPSAGQPGGLRRRADSSAAAGVLEPRRWWWELRPHPVYGTLEMRVCDAQPEARRTARWPASCTRSSLTCRSSTGPARCRSRSPAGGSPRTAGRRAATGSPGRWPTRARGAGADHRARRADARRAGPCRAARRLRGAARRCAHDAARRRRGGAQARDGRRARAWRPDRMARRALRLRRAAGRPDMENLPEGLDRS